ncbi:MAG: hypothetical protein P8X79_15730 [Reinekea sp.]
MTSPHKQAGISLIGMGILVFLIVFFGLLIVKMSGAYYDQFTLNKMIHVALDDQTAGNFSKVEFDDRMRKNMDMNVHLFFNVDVVMVFKHEYEL